MERERRENMFPLVGWFEEARERRGRRERNRD
jgi:hypothetical protein